MLLDLSFALFAIFISWVVTFLLYHISASMLIFDDVNPMDSVKLTTIETFLIVVAQFFRVFPFGGLVAAGLGVLLPFIMISYTRKIYNTSILNSVLIIAVIMIFEGLFYLITNAIGIFPLST